MGPVNAARWFALADVGSRGFHHHQRRQQLANLSGQLGMILLVFRERRLLAAAIALQELLGEFLEGVAPGFGAGHDAASRDSSVRDAWSSKPGTASNSVLSRLRARTKRLLAAASLRPSSRAVS